MEKITNVSALPEWFSNQVYRKQLSDIDWYREIQMREIVRTMANLGPYTGPSDEKLRYGRHNFLSVETTRPDSVIYQIPTRGDPVGDVSVLEAAFLGFSVEKFLSNNLLNEFNTLLEIWGKFLKEDNVRPDNEKLPPPYEYEKKLGLFIDLIRDEDSAFHSNVENFSKQLGNPFLSYGNVINGYPLTIDTSFDDETIVLKVKEWLAKKREEENTKSRRPFNQNDFDDWEYYKIRQIFDLQIWAQINETKILDRVIADAVWPNAPEDFSPIEVLRTTARKKVTEVFSYETVLQMYGQLVILHGVNFLVE